VGASGTGVLTSAGEVEGRPAVAVLLVESESIGLRAFGSENLRGRDEAVAGELAGALRRPGRIGAPARDERARLLVLFPDPSVFNPMLFFPALERWLGPLPSVGGGATSLVGQPASVTGHRQIARGLAGMLIQGRFSTRIATLPSVRLVSKVMKVTRSHGNLVGELDGLPALGVFQNLASRILGLDPFRAAQSLVVALRPSGPGTTEPAFVVRNLFGLGPARLGLALSQLVAVGEEIAFCVLEPQEARRRLKEALGPLRGSKPGFALYFNCSGRGQSFYGEAGVDTGQIRDMLGKIPMAGFFSSAEIAPSGDRNLLHLYTGVLTLIYPEG